jgi:hypothetical protein
VGRINRTVGRDADAVWAVTAYFNPKRYRRRRDNYRVFRECLNAPLVTVELAYGPDFELGPEDADILIQLRGRDVLWQKERLLNVALQSLPASCRKVVSVDCDLVFESADWLERTSLLLDRFLVVQPFSHVHRMPIAWSPGQTRPAETESLRSPAFLLASGMPLSTCLGTPAEQLKCALGGAWAARRDLLDAHAFYDACILGGGDNAFVRAAYGCFEEAMRLHLMNARRRQHYLAWARPFFDAVRGSVGFADGDLLHLWHGTPHDRRYRSRNQGLEPFQFDPYSDIAIDDNGPWRWNSDKREMHAYVSEYFSARMEDG